MHFFERQHLDVDLPDFPSNCCIFVYSYKDGDFCFKCLIDPIKGIEIPFEG